MVVSATPTIVKCAKLIKDLKANVTPDSVEFHVFVQPGRLCTLKNFIGKLQCLAGIMRDRSEVGG